MSLAFLRSAANIDRIGLAGVAILAGICAFYFLGMRPLQSRVTALSAEVAAAKGRLPQRGATGEIPSDLASNYADSLRSAYSQLIPANEAAAVIVSLNEAAMRAGLRLQSGDYRLEPEPDTNLVRYRVVVTTRGTFVQIREFVERAVAALPASGLDEIGIKRARIDEARLEAQLGFSILLRGERPAQ